MCYGWLRDAICVGLEGVDALKVGLGGLASCLDYIMSCWCVRSFLAI